VDFWDQRTQLPSSTPKKKDDLFSACNWSIKTSLLEIAHSKTEIERVLDESDNSASFHLKSGEEEMLQLRLNRLVKLNEQRSLDSTSFGKHRKTAGVAFGKAVLERLAAADEKNRTAEPNTTASKRRKT
jgi:hypothetical protein